MELDLDDTAVDFSVKPFKAFDLLDIPLLHQYLSSMLSDILQDTPIKVNLQDVSGNQR
jgi:hypothetical protein